MIFQQGFFEKPTTKCYNSGLTYMLYIFSYTCISIYTIHFSETTKMFCKTTISWWNVIHLTSRIMTIKTVTSLQRAFRPFRIYIIYSYFSSLFFFFTSAIDNTIWLTLNLMNYIHGLANFQFLELSNICFGVIKTRTWSWSANSIEPDQTARMCRPAWLYTFGSSRIRVKLWVAEELSDILT